MLRCEANKSLRTRPWRVVLSLIACILLIRGGPVYSQTIDEAKAVKIKAGCLYHLAKMVTWPQNKFENDQSPIVVGFLGKDPHGIAGYFESQAQSFTVQGRSLVVKRFQQMNRIDTRFREELRRCHILFITASEQKHLQTILDILGNSSVLTAGEKEAFPSSGGMVSFVIAGGRVRIRVNLDAVKQAKLKVSAQFLQHAAIVKSNEKTRLPTGQVGLFGIAKGFKVPKVS